MGVRERILTIRLLEKIGMHPEYAGKLGMEAVNADLRFQRRTDPEAVGQMP